MGLWKHAFKNAALPVVTYSALIIVFMVRGSVIVETVFAIPGLGRLFVDATFQRDVPVLMGLTLLSGIATLSGITLADMTYAVADPRARRA